MNGPMWMYRHLPRVTHMWRRRARANYEREMELLPGLCDPQRTGVDVGAKVGMYTYRIRDASSDVVAFEPIPLFNRMLRAVFEGKRGHIEPVAVSATPGKVTMRLPYDADNEQQFGRATIEAANPLKAAEVARVEELEVETRTIDSYEWKSLGFIKVDVEGHELSVLAGAEETIAKHRPNLLIECNDDHAVDGTKRLAQWFADHDYDVVFFDRDRLRPYAEYDRGVHWQQHFIENFIGVPKGDAERRRRLDAQAAIAAKTARAVSR